MCTGWIASILNIMRTKKFVLFLILNYLYKAKAFTTIEDIESKNLLQLEQENSELIEGTHLGFKF